MFSSVRSRSSADEEACKVLMDLDAKHPVRFGESIIFYRYGPGPEGLRLIRGDEVVGLSWVWFWVGGRRLRYDEVERIQLGDQVLFQRGDAPGWDFEYLKSFVPAGHGIAANSYMNAP